MKRTSKENIAISREIESVIPVRFEDSEFDLDEWGNADNYGWIDKQSLVLLECEKGQKHPKTNVIKVWPYLESRPDISILLIHVFSFNNTAPKNRIRICDFVADKIKKSTDHRLSYLRLIGSPANYSSKLKEEFQSFKY